MSLMTIHATMQPFYSPKAIVLTDQHIAEALSRAYVRAIAGRAGLNLAIREYDYGVDGSFDEVVMRQNRRVESGLALPADSSQWLICEESELRLQGTCYWEYLSGSLSENRQSVRIRIPRSQRLTPESLLTLIENVKTGEW
jgi:Domain of unknown function (DUF4365)